MPAAAIITVPYLLARERVGMGAGPDRLLSVGADLIRHLGELGANATVVEVRLERDGIREIDAVAELNLKVAAEVRAAVAARAFPIVLSGCCHTSLGILAGLQAPGTAVAWFDAHGDFNTPASSPSGLLDGMSLSMVTGRCHIDLVRQIGLEPVHGHLLLHLGGRDFDRQERQALLASGAAVIPPEELASRRVSATLGPELHRLVGDADGAYVHIDLDVLDRRRYPANEYQPDGGLLLDEVTSAVRLIADRLPVRAAALTAYDPARDPRGATVPAALRILQTLCASRVKTHG